MIKHAWTVFCDRALTDNDSNNLGLFTVEQISFPSPERADGDNVILPFSGNLVSLWYRDSPEDKQEFTFRVTAISADGSKIAETPSTVSFTGKKRLRTFARIPFIPIPPTISCNMRFIVDFKQGDSWITVADIPLELVPIPSAASPHGE
jgi:hypothetical protein